MAKATWQGSLSFGLVSCPVKVYPIRGKESAIRFNEINKNTMNRVGRQRIDKETNEVVSQDDIIKGYEVEKDTYVIVSPEEIANLLPEKSKQIEIETFVETTDVSSIYYDTAYYLAPQEGAEKPYVLLEEALRQTNKIAIGRIVLRAREYLCTIKPIEGERGLVMHTLIWQNALRSPAEVIGDINAATTAQEIAIASRLVEEMSKPIDLRALTDSYTEQVLALIDAKRRGEEIVIPQVAHQESSLADNLLAALEMSVNQAREQREAG